VCEEYGYSTRKVFNAEKMCVRQKIDEAGIRFTGIRYEGCFHQWHVSCSTVYTYKKSDDGNGVERVIMTIPKPDPIRKHYEQVKYRYIMRCGHYTPAAECRQKALEICESNNFTFQKLEVYGTNCVSLVREEPEDYVHCANSLKIHCTGREGKRLL
jgi:hypothetical protein